MASSKGPDCLKREPDTGSPGTEASSGHTPPSPRRAGLEGLRDVADALKARGQPLKALFAEVTLAFCVVLDAPVVFLRWLLLMALFSFAALSAAADAAGMAAAHILHYETPVDALPFPLKHMEDKFGLCARVSAYMPERKPQRA